MSRSDVGNSIAQHFARWLPHYLPVDAHVHRPSVGKGMEAIRWAGQSPEADRTLLLISQLWLAQMEGIAPAVGATSGWIPLQVVLKGTWCLMAPQKQHLPDYSALQTWLQSLQRPVRLAVPHNFGPPELWRQAMSRKTGLPWISHSVASARQSLQALASGAVDLALDRCGDSAQALDVWRSAARSERSPVQVLAQLGVPKPLPVASFSQWRLPPLAPGWMGWFVRAEMPMSRQVALGKALHAILLREDTQALISALQQQPLTLSTADSRLLVHRTQEQDQLLRLWLERAGDPLSGPERAAPL